MMAHFGSIVACDTGLEVGTPGPNSAAVCAVLPRPAFDALRRESPEMENQLQIYLSRKRFMATGRHCRAHQTPKLLL